jgi:hypothetical protein
MPYNPAIPQPTDQLSISQGDLLGNFMAIQTLIDVNHVDFASADMGKHKFVSFPQQVAAPATANTEWAMYNAVSATSGDPELFLRAPNNGGTLNFTESLAAPNGWTRLPSAILLKWGSAGANGLTTITFPVGANIPPFLSVFNILVTTSYGSATDGDAFVRFNSVVAPWTQFQVYASARTTVTNKATGFTYLAIGV